MVFDDKTFIAKKIKLARKNAKITQEELAEKIGITAKQLSRIELATYIPSLPTFLKIVYTLKIDLNDFGITNQENENSLRDEIKKIIYNSTDEELKFYLEMLKTMSNNFSLIKK